MDNENSTQSNILLQPLNNPLWLTISESAKLGGVTTKTIRRAVQSKAIKYKIVGNRYFVDLASVIQYLHTNTKLKNKLHTTGLGQYIKIWAE